MILLPDTKCKIYTIVKPGAAYAKSPLADGAVTAECRFHGMRIPVTPLRRRLFMPVRPDCWEYPDDASFRCFLSCHAAVGLTTEAINIMRWYKIFAILYSTGIICFFVAIKNDAMFLLQYSPHTARNHCRGSSCKTKGEMFFPKEIDAVSLRIIRRDCARLHRMIAAAVML